MDLLSAEVMLHLSPVKEMDRQPQHRTHELLIFVHKSQPQGKIYTGKPLLALSFEPVTFQLKS